MTALAIALVLVALLAFIDRALARKAADVTSAGHYDAQPAVITICARLDALEGLADRVRELENADSGDVAALVAKAEAKYDAIIRNGINECRQMIVSATDPQLRTPMARALKAVKDKQG